MAKKKPVNLEMTPLMMLSVMAFFLMLPLVITVSNTNKKVSNSRAAEPREVVIVTPTETPDPSDVLEY